VVGTPRLLRAINDRAALDLLLDRGPLTRPQIAELLGTSKATASQLLARLGAAGLVREAGTSGGRTGPSAVRYAVNGAAAHAAAVAVTAHRITATIVDLTGRVAGRSDGTPVGEPLRDVRRAVAVAARRAGVTVGAIGCAVVGLPGALDPRTDALRLVAELRGWSRPGLGVELGRLRYPARVENDVNLAAVAERRRGVAAEPDAFALLWAGTGLGVAIDLEGRMLRGATGGAGEIGYIPVGDTDFQHLAGAAAVVELARAHGLVARDAEEAVRSGVSHEPFLDELARRLATGLAAIVGVLDPAMVVLGGPTCAAGGERLRAAVERELYALFPLHPVVASSAVGGEPVLAGAEESALGWLRDLAFRTIPEENRSQQ
jgi:predicted NBD/HSP70 family sugar kinase